jgi:hypothetical protein
MVTPCAHEGRLMEGLHRCLITAGMANGLVIWHPRSEQEWQPAVLQGWLHLISTNADGSPILQLTYLGVEKLRSLFEAMQDQ